MVKDIKATDTTSTTTQKPINTKILVKALVYLKYNSQRYAIGQTFEIDRADSSLIKNNYVEIVK